MSNNPIRVNKFGVCIVRPNGVVILKGFEFVADKSAASGNTADHKRLAHQAALESTIRILTAALEKTQLGAPQQ